MSSKVQRREAVENRLIAMSHPVRREVLRVLVECPSSPVEIGRELDVPTANVSHHAKRLVELGCAELVEERKVQGAIQHIYRATELTLVSREEWDQMHPGEARVFVAEIMQKILDDFIASEKAQIVGMDSDFHLSRTPISLDLEGLREAVQLMEGVRLEVDNIARRSVERSRYEGGEIFPVSSFLGIFRMPG